MCGICGIIQFDPDRFVSPETIRSLTSTLVHRGPDDEGYFIDKNIALGHRRLSIIDLQKGHQPMFNEDGSVMVLFNGEIYNFKELRTRLQSSGHGFATDSDTEVLVHGYEEWGMDDLLAACNGMFAFCLFDRKQGLFFLVRDRLGKKPLYYASQVDRFLFSSEIRGLVTGGFVPKEISVTCLNHYVRLHFPYGRESMIRGIYRLLPGEYLSLEWRTKKVTNRQYWDLEAGKVEAPVFDGCVEHLRFLLQDSVHLRSVADVPVGTFLSGGLDSSIVTGLLAGIVQPLNTFSIGFREGGFDESRESSLVASHFHTHHRHFVLTQERFIQLLREITATIDEPVADAASVPTFWLSHEARKQVKVVLTGEGSDELFAGYDHYRSFLADAPSTRKGTAESPTDRRKENGMASGDDGAASRVSGLPFAVPDKLHRMLLAPDYLGRDALACLYDELRGGFRQAKGSRLDQAQMADIRSWLADDVLMKLDKMSMLNSLEARAPFLDYRLVEFALSIPEDFRVHKGVEKYILRESFTHLLPPAISGRRKQGFNLPLDQWFRDGLSALLADYASPEKIREHGFFDAQAVGDVITSHQRHGAQFARLLFLILMLQMWWDAL